MLKNSGHSQPSSYRRYRDPFPMHRLKRVEEPTTKIVGEIKRVDERECGFNRALRGDFGPNVAEERVRFASKYPLSAALGDMALHLAPKVDGTVNTERAPIPADPAILTRHIKELAYFLRADLVGICKVPTYAVYSYDKEGNQVHLTHKYAVVILIDQDYKTINASTGHDWISNSQSFLSYSTSALISCNMAAYIRKLGYTARAHHARDYQVLVPPLLLWAGMGEICRIGGIVLNPFLGPRYKASVVTTDLPLVPDKPVDFGLQDFCAVCKKCARVCPSGAISKGDKVIYNGYELWKEDTEKCTKYRVTNSHGSGSGTCIKVCPWNKPDTWYHRASVWAVERSVIASKLLLWMDDFMGYGKPMQKDKWWFDLEEINGKLYVPEKKHGSAK